MIARVRIYGRGGISERYGLPRKHKAQWRISPLSSALQHGYARNEEYPRAV